MTLAQFTTGQHDQSCSGCPACSEEMAAILAHPYDPVLHDRMRAAAAARRPVFRVSGPRRDEVPPDPYALSLPKPVSPSDDPHYEPHGQPPDGYALAIERKKKESQ